MDEAVATLSRGPAQDKVDVVHGYFNFVIVKPSDFALALLHTCSVNTDGDVYLVHVGHVVAQLRVGVLLARSAEEWAVFGNVADITATGALQESHSCGGSLSLRIEPQWLRISMNYERRLSELHPACVAMKLRIQDVDVWSGFVLRVRKSRVAGSRTIIAAVLVAADVFAAF